MEFFKIRRDIPFMENALVFNVVSFLTFAAARTPGAWTPLAARWLRQDPAVVVWTLTRVELCSALARQRRDDHRDAAALTAARRDLRSQNGRREWKDMA